MVASLPTEEVLGKGVHLWKFIPYLFPSCLPVVNETEALMVAPITESLRLEKASEIE